MSQIILDMPSIATRSLTADSGNSQRVLDTLMALLSQPLRLFGGTQVDEVLERAALYEKSQPSFAADLRAAVERSDA